MMSLLTCVNKLKENENEYKPCELIGIVVKELTLEQWNQIIE